MARYAARRYPRAQLTENRPEDRRRPRLQKDHRPEIVEEPTEGMEAETQKMEAGSDLENFQEHLRDLPEEEMVTMQFSNQEILLNNAIGAFEDLPEGRPLTTKQIADLQEMDKAITDEMFEREEPKALEQALEDDSPYSRELLNDIKENDPSSASLVEEYLSAEKKLITLQTAYNALESTIKEMRSTGEQGHYEVFTDEWNETIGLLNNLGTLRELLMTSREDVDLLQLRLYDVRQNLGVSKEEKERIEITASQNSGAEARNRYARRQANRTPRSITG